MADYTPLERRLLFSKNDPRDPRLGDLICTTPPKEAADIVISGYPDDEGIKLNGGRPGAALAPKEIRHWLYRMTPHPRRPIRTMMDVGDLNLNGTLLERQDRATQFATRTLAAGTRTLTFGGGNDYAFSDGMAFLQTYKDLKPLVINVDAHLDVREMDRGPHSGTPFFRLLESGIKFDFIEFGIQGQCNSTQHWNYVEKKGGKIITLDELMDTHRPLVESAVALFGETLLRQQRPTFLAIDIDAFAWPYAVGSSASWPIGLDPLNFWPFYQLLLKRLDVRALGIYEVSPPLDTSGGTAKLAAQFAHGFLHHV